MARYWIMRVDHREANDFLWNELKAGRLRQGWGYRADQNLETIAARKKKDAGITDEQQDAWRGNRRMLGSEPDSIQKGDVVFVPHLPEHRHWSIARVVGPYRFEIPKAPKDYGHILPVELLSEDRPVSFQAKGVAAGLRSTARGASSTREARTRTVPTRSARTSILWACPTGSPCRSRCGHGTPAGRDRVSNTGHIIAALAGLPLVFASWALRPDSRKLPG